MQAKPLATDLGEALKWTTTVRDVERNAKALFPCQRTSYPNEAITSQRSQLIYDWVLSLSMHPLAEPKKEELLAEFAKRITPKEQIQDIIEVFRRNGISERLFDGLTYTIIPPPSFARLTSSVPVLEQILQDRWVEAQKCERAGAHLSAVILMGSILEGLLLSKALALRPDAYKSRFSPKDKKSGSAISIENWTLHDLIEVAVDCGWLKVDRGSFSHALRQSRNIVHPWAQMSERADFDGETCKTCWQVLSSAVKDLTK
ncbi:MAG: hypothetical protein RLZZ505_2175 [Verrucomicrobiota bacterium]|jgi:hypothetical protein